MHLMWLPSDLRAQLRAAFGDAEVVVLHSAPRAIGWVAGGVEAIARAVLDVCEDRTLIVPTFTVGRMDPSTWTEPPVPQASWDAIRAELPIFDPDWSPPHAMGRIAELVWHARGAVRSSHPVESVAAIGPRAAEIVRPHPIEDPMGPRSPWARLYGLDARVVMLGVGLERCSLLHHAERMAEVPYVEAAAYGVPVVIDGERRWIEAESGNNCSEGFPRLEPSLRKAGLVADATVGDARALSLSARDLVDHARAAIAADAAALLCERRGCVACGEARRVLGRG